MPLKGERSVTLNGASIYFWDYQTAGSGVGVTPPKGWHLDYRDRETLKPVKATTAYRSRLDATYPVSFTLAAARCLRAAFDASTDGKSYAAVAAQEWQAFTVTPQVPVKASVKGPASTECAQR
ncbi:hypothetical protein [Asticcacaulis excentricus]|uniref:hypothetical protein n=1 Tax=Asticcacaulis excentricus TaxID=78587 RepID=UPI00143B36A0|nr:hypothetical protein [Asticcacaulis excentricus]